VIAADALAAPLLLLILGKESGEATNSHQLAQ